jgi:DNA recombination protein RmuC
MTSELIVITLLVLNFVILLFLLLKLTRNKKITEQQDINKIEEKLTSILNQTIEHSGYVNSKIDEIGDLTKKMTNAMTSNISDMGEMGEIILENILDNCGMTKDRDYKTQYTGKNEDGNYFRPDVVVFLPEKRNIIIDSKVPIKDWYEYQNSNDKKIKKIAMQSFISALKNHINSIYKKNYKDLMNINSQDYIFIFMPHDYAYVSAQKFDSSLATFAQEKQIIIVGPSTLIMCMKLVESLWKVDKQNKNSVEIANLAGQMYDQIIKSLILLEDSEKNLNKTIDSVSNVKSYIKNGRGSLFNKAEEMRKLGANNKKKIN